MSDARRSSTAVSRNVGPIIDVLRDILPADGVVLEVASGTGEHVAAFAAAFPSLRFRPTDSDADARASIAAWTASLANVETPIALDAAAADWRIAHADAILCINMVHISPWSATAGLMAGASRLLRAGAPLYLYGPYRRAGVATAPSNEAFDESLKRRDRDWGLRDLDAVMREGKTHGLTLQRVVTMPANNLSLLFRRV